MFFGPWARLNLNDLHRHVREYQVVNVAGHRIATDSSVTARKITGHCRRIPRAAVTICDSVRRNQARGICHYKIAVPKVRRAWTSSGLNLAKLFLHDQKIRRCALEAKFVASVALRASANAQTPSLPISLLERFILAIAQLA